MKNLLYIFLLIHSATIYAQQLYPFPQDGKWGYIDQNGRTIVRPKYYSGGFFVDGMAKVSIINERDEYLYGFIDATGREVIPPRFANVSDFSEGMARIKIRDTFSLLLKNGTVLTLQDVDEIFPATNGMAAYRKGDRYGYINTNGMIAVSNIFTVANPFSDSGVAVVSVDERKREFGVIDATGEYIINPKYSEIKNFVEGFSAVKDGRSWFVVDSKGIPVTMVKFDNVGEFSNGLLNVKKGDWGYIDSKGDMVISPRFKRADKFSNGLAIVSDGKFFSYINTSGEELITPYAFTRVTRFDGKLARVSQGNKNGFMNAEGRFNLTDKISSIGSFFNGRARLRANNHYGYYSSDARLAIKPVYLYASDFRGDLALTVAPMTGGYRVTYINASGKDVKSWNITYQPILKNRDIFYTLVYPSIPFYKDSDPASSIIIRASYGNEFTKTHQRTATPIDGHGLSGMLYTAEYFSRPGYIFSEVVSRYNPPKIGIGISTYFRENIGVIYETDSPTAFSGPMSAVFFNGATLNRSVGRTTVEDKYFIPFMKVTESLFLFASALGYPISEYPQSGNLPNFLSNPETVKFAGRFSREDVPTGYTLTFGRSKVTVTEGKFGINMSYSYPIPNITVVEDDEPIFSSDSKLPLEDIVIEDDALEERTVITNIATEETIVVEDVPVTSVIETSSEVISDQVTETVDTPAETVTETE